MYTQTIQKIGITAIFFSLIGVGSIVMAQETQPMDPSARSWKMIDEAIQSKNDDKRQAIVVAASLGGAYDKVFAFLDKALDDTKVPVRVAACTSLASLKDPRSVPPLKKALTDPVPEVFFCAAQGLWMRGESMGEKVLLEVLEGEKGIASGFLSSHQREAMAAFNNPHRFFSTLFHLGIRFAPVPGLAMGYTSMMQLTKDHKASGKVLAAMDLARGNDAESEKALVGALKDTSPLVRAAAVHSLALRNNPAVRNELIPLLDDKEYPVSYRAAVAYLRLTKVAQDGSQTPISQAP